MPSPSEKSKKKQPAALDNPGEKTPFPLELEPMLATLTDKPFDEEGWLYEVKWDGYRALAFLNNNTVELKSRNSKSFNEKFYPITKALQLLELNAVLDGEIVVVNEKGLPDFSALQNWRSEADGQLLFYVFDLLWLNGNSLLNLALHERRSILQSAIQPTNLIKHSDSFDAGAEELFKLADKMGLEGIMAKKATSIYQPGKRTKDWLKIKTEKRQEAVIGGYTINKDTSKPFSALLLGMFHGKAFHSFGTVGTGFNVQFQRELIARLRPLETKECPFVVMPEFNKPSRFRPNPPAADVVWVKPEVVCEVSYRELTKDGAIRHPSFKGLREDKKAQDVVLETPVTLADVKEEKNTFAKQKLIAAPGKSERNSLLNPTEETQAKKVGGHELKFTNLSKVFWPDVGVTKRDMLNYYYQVAPYMLPYLKDRPQTLNRYPNGIHGKTFYQKDVKGKAPDWATTFPYHSYTDGRDKEFLVCTNEASLLYIAAMGCIEINPWSSKTTTPDNPDWCIIDLDPDKNTFEQVIEVACITKEVLDAIEVAAYAKTSGSTGMHIYIPLGGRYTYEQSKEFGRVIAKIVHGQVPEFTSIERKVSDRSGKMYIDFLQNRPQATVAAPYSLRPKPGAPVSMPLHWSEVKKGLSIKQFTIFNAVDRVKQEGDLFKGVLGKGINMEKASEKIEALFTAN